MSHMIDVDAVTGKATMAFVGEEAWHGLGNRLTPDASIDVWMQESGTGYEVKRAPVSFHDGHRFQKYDAKHVIFRADTGTPLSVMGNELAYKLVQPAQVWAFFRDVMHTQGFSIETAGALDGGRRIWVLAKINDGAPILDGDIVRPYVLGCTSYDGSMSTTFKLTAIRVVCHNTLTASVGYGGEGAPRGQSEKDEPHSIVRVPHSKDFDADAARVDLGIFLNDWEKHLAEMRRLARQPVDDEFVVAFLKELLPKVEIPEGKTMMDNLTAKRIVRLFNEGTGQDLEGANGTAWGLLNAVTEYVDHQRGVEANRRTSAWFGTGEGMKNRAQELLLKVAA